VSVIFQCTYSVCNYYFLILCRLSYWKSFIVTRLKNEISCFVPELSRVTRNPLLFKLTFISANFAQVLVRYDTFFNTARTTQISRVADPVLVISVLIRIRLSCWTLIQDTDQDLFNNDGSGSYRMNTGTVPQSCRFHCVGGCWNLIQNQC
jgi:hypothetical protein